MASVPAVQNGQGVARESLLEIVGASVRSLGYVGSSGQELKGEVGGFSVGGGTTFGYKVDVRVDHGEITIHDLKHRGNIQTHFVFETQQAIQTAVDGAYGVTLRFKQPERRPFDCMIRP